MNRTAYQLEQFADEMADLISDMGTPVRFIDVKEMDVACFGMYAITEEQIQTHFKPWVIHKRNGREPSWVSNVTRGMTFGNIYHHLLYAE